MYGCDALACLELHHDAVVHKEIESCFTDFFLLVLHGNRYLPGKSDAAERQLNTQCFFVDGFQKARAEMPMHFDRRPNHSMHNGIQRCARLLSPKFLGDLGVLAVHPLPSTQPAAELPRTPVLY